MSSLDNYEIILAVPFCEKNDAKKLGAKWNSSQKYWFCHKNSANKNILIEKWSVNTNPVYLEGEDRTFGGNDLFIDLIPSTCWFSNVRSCIHPKDWDRVRKYIYERVNYCCECCGINTMNDNSNGQLEAHERWNYDDKYKIQKLMRIIALCHQCHQSTHMGLAGILGKKYDAMEHLQKVKCISQSEAEEENNEAFKLYRLRSICNWELDISLITNAGISIIKKDERDQIMGNEINKINKNIISNSCSLCKRTLCYLESSYDWECDLCQIYNLKTTKHLHCVSCETDICKKCFDKEPTNIKTSNKSYAILNGHRISTELYDEICKNAMESCRIYDLHHNITRYQDLPYNGRYDESNLDLDYESN